MRGTGRVANKFHLRILSEIPKSLRRLWSDCIAATLMKFAKAKTDGDSFRALESWVKLKSVLVLPLVSKKRRSSSFKLHQEQMLNWIAGSEEDCWVKATKVEKERKNSRKRRYSKQRLSQSRCEEDGQIDPLTSAQMTKYKRAKNLVNVGEISKAMSSILSNGVAKVDDDILHVLLFTYHLWK